MEPDALNPAEDNFSQADKISKYTGTVDWNYIQPHFEAGNLVSVSPALKLEEVALAFAEDDKQRVQTWLQTAAIIQPTAEDAEKMKAEGQQFVATIVRPFVLVQSVS